MPGDSIELVREVDTYCQELSIDIFEWSGSADAPAGWKVRVKAYDGKSPMPSLFELRPGGKSARATQPLFAETVAKFKADGWAEALSKEAQARIDARRAKEQAEEKAKEADLARRLKAFPVSDQDRALAAAIAKP